MYCPRCGVENDTGQGYCRGCGLSLPAVRLAAEGRVEEALAKLSKGAGGISGGALIFVIGLLNALVNGYFAAWQSAVVSALVGSAVGVPLVAAGLARVGRARRLLSPEEDVKGLPGAGRETPAPLHGAPDGALNPEPSARASVTEHTTLKLDSSGPARRK